MGGSELFESLFSEMHKVIVGQDAVIKALLRSLLCGGHVLIEGVPGLAKTAIVRTVAEVTGCKFQRIQFTSDLLPSDIIGINSFDQELKSYKIIQGPIFTQILMADEINRASPKVQSALLEAMAESQVTLGNKTIKLKEPFIVYATQNSLESLGTYPLPPAQLDRFLFKILISYPSLESEMQIVDSNLQVKNFDSFNLQSLLTPEMIVKLQEETKARFISDDVKRYALTIVHATRHPKHYHIDKGEFIENPCGPRASIALVLAAKADALLQGKSYVTPLNVKNVAHDVLRHRLEVNYLGLSKNVTSDVIITEILQKIPVP